MGNPMKNGELTVQETKQTKNLRNNIKDILVGLAVEFMRSQDHGKQTKAVDLFASLFKQKKGFKEAMTDSDLKLMSSGDNFARQKAMEILKLLVENGYEPSYPLASLVSGFYISNYQEKNSGNAQSLFQALFDKQYERSYFNACDAAKKQITSQSCGPMSYANSNNIDFIKVLAEPKHNKAHQALLDVVKLLFENDAFSNKQLATYVTLKLVQQKFEPAYDLAEKIATI